MATLKEYLNKKIKEKGSSVKKEKASADKYKSIAAAKKAGSLYYTNKEGKIMAAVYASDLSKPLSGSVSTSLRPKARPKPKPKGPSSSKGQSGATGPLSRGGRSKPLEGSGKQPQRGSVTILPREQRGKALMQNITRKQWENMTKSERRRNGLPASKVAAMMHPLRDAKFKDGKGF
jgi:hypothetical protein